MSYRVLCNGKHGEIGKTMFIEYNIFGDDCFTLPSETLIAFVSGRKTKVNTLGTSKLEFVFVVWFKVGKTRTTKGLDL